MTRDGTFLVEGGKIVGPVREPPVHAVLPRRARRDQRGRAARARRSRASSARRSCPPCASTAGPSPASPSSELPDSAGRPTDAESGSALGAAVRTRRRTAHPAALAAPLDRRGPARHRRADRDPRSRLRLRDRRHRAALGGSRRCAGVLHGAVRGVPGQLVRADRHRDRAAGRVRGGGPGGDAPGAVRRPRADRPPGPPGAGDPVSLGSGDAAVPRRADLHRPDRVDGGRGELDPSGRSTAAAVLSAGRRPRRGRPGRARPLPRARARAARARAAPP